MTPKQKIQAIKKVLGFPFAIARYQGDEMGNVEAYPIASDEEGVGGIEMYVFSNSKDIQEFSTNSLLYDAIARAAFVALPEDKRLDFEIGQKMPPTIYGKLATWLKASPFKIAQIEKEIEIYPTGLSQWLAGKMDLSSYYKPKLLTWANKYGFFQSLGYSKAHIEEDCIILETYELTGEVTEKEEETSTHFIYHANAYKSISTWEDLEYERF